MSMGIERTRLDRGELPSFGGSRAATRTPHGLHCHHRDDRTDHQIGFDARARGRQRWSIELSNDSFWRARAISTRVHRGLVLWAYVGALDSLSHPDSANRYQATPSASSV